MVLSPSRKYFVLEFVLQKSRQLICGIIKTRFLAILAFSLKNTWIFTPTRLFSVQWQFNTEIWFLNTFWFKKKKLVKPVLPEKLSRTEQMSILVALHTSWQNLHHCTKRTVWLRFLIRITGKNYKNKLLWNNYMNREISFNFF